MVEHEISHLIVVEPHTARPIGVLSTLDVARALAGFPETHPVGMKVEIMQPKKAAEARR